MSGFYTTQSEKMPFQVPDKHVGWEHTLWLYTCSDGQTSSGTREPVSFPAGGGQNSRLFRFSRKYFIPIITNPSSFLQGFEVPPTMIIFLKESGILRRE